MSATSRNARVTRRFQRRFIFAVGVVFGSFLYYFLVSNPPPESFWVYVIAFPIAMFYAFIIVLMCTVVGIMAIDSYREYGKFKQQKGKH